MLLSVWPGDHHAGHAGGASRIHKVQVDSQTKELMEGCSKHLKLGLEALASKINTSSKLLERGEILEQVVWLLESVGLSAILCGVVLSLIRGGGGAKGGKKGKKGKGAVQQQFSELVDSYTSMLGGLQEVASKFLELTEKLEASISAESLVRNMSGGQQVLGADRETGGKHFSRKSCEK